MGVYYLGDFYVGRHAFADAFWTETAASPPRNMKPSRVTMLSRRQLLAFLPDCIRESNAARLPPRSGRIPQGTRSKGAFHEPSRNRGHGNPKPDGTLDLDQKLNLAPGRVTVVLRQESEAPVPSRRGLVAIHATTCGDSIDELLRESPESSTGRS